MPGAPGSTTNQTWITGIRERAAGPREAANILDDLLPGGMARRPGAGEGAALGDHVVLQILNDESAAGGIEHEPSRPLSIRRRDGIRVPGAGLRRVCMKGSRCGPTLVRTV